MANVSMIIKLKAQPGKRDEMLEVMRGLVDAAEQEPGTLQYVFNTPDDDPDTVWAFELYTDDDALNTHSASPAMAEVIGKFGGLVDGMPEMIKATVAMGKGL